MPFEWLEYLFLNYINNYGYDDRRDFYLKELYKSEQRQKYEKEVEGLHDDLISLLGYDDKEAQADEYRTLAKNIDGNDMFVIPKPMEQDRLEEILMEYGFLG
jgi:nitrogenase subunit NifH